MFNSPFENLFSTIIILLPEVSPSFVGHVFLSNSAENESCNASILFVNVSLEFFFKQLIGGRPTDKFVVDMLIDCSSGEFSFLNIGNNLHEDFIQISCIRSICDISSDKEASQQLDCSQNISVSNFKRGLIFEQIHQQQIRRCALNTTQVGQAVGIFRFIVGAEDKPRVNLTAYQNVAHKAGQISAYQFLKNGQQIGTGGNIAERIFLALPIRSERLV